MAAETACRPPQASSLLVRVKVVSEPLLPLTACDFVAFGTGRAAKTLQRKDCTCCRSSESPICPKGSKPNESGVGLSSPASPPRKGLVYVQGFALDLKRSERNVDFQSYMFL